MQEKKILNKMIKIMFKTIGSTKDVKSSLLIKHFLFVLSMNFASIFVVFVKNSYVGIYGQLLHMQDYEFLKIFWPSCVLFG